MSAWADQSGASNDFAQAVAADMPALIRGTGPVAFLHFDGASDYLTRAPIAAIGSGYSLALAAATKQAGVGSVMCNGSRAADGFRLRSATGAVYDHTHGGVATVAFGSTASGSTEALVLRHSAGNSNLQIDGVDEAPVALAVELAPYTTTCRIGADSVAGQCAHMHLPELAGYSVALTAAETAVLSAYLGMHT